MWDIVQRDVLDWAKEYNGPKFHAMFCDPPYHLGKSGFMGKNWDSADYGVAFQPETWAALGEHLYPGAFIFVFASSRGWHRLACAIEDAGFVFHPSFMVWGWAFGSGFPKTARIDVKCDELAGAERDVVEICKGRGPNTGLGYLQWNNPRDTADRTHYEKTIPATDLAKSWDGHRYGRQAIKPAVEMIICAQKPYDGKPFECIVETGAGALNIDGSRIETSEEDEKKHLAVWNHNQSQVAEDGSAAMRGGLKAINLASYAKVGRWPANFVLKHHPECEIVGYENSEPYAINSYDNGAKPFGGGAGREYSTEKMQGGKVPVYRCHPDCAVLKLAEQRGYTISSRNEKSCKCHWDTDSTYRGTFQNNRGEQGYTDRGTAVRFFFQADWSAEIAEGLLNADPVYYCPKASPKERHTGLAGMQPKKRDPNRKRKCAKNFHPTVKPLALCKHLSTLLLPPESYEPRRLLVPFCGSGSEMISAVLVGWEQVIGIEREFEYVEIAERRLEHWCGGMLPFGE